MIWIIIGVVFLALILFGIFYDDRDKCFEEKSGFGLVDEKGCHGVDCIERSIAHIICTVLINGGMNNEHKNSERFKY